jgi:hypothetical protein
VRAVRGFEFAETMTGTWWPESTGGDGGERPLSFTLRARSRSLVGGVAEVEGTLEADGLATGAAVTGTLTIRPLRERVIRYELAFTDDGGRPLRLVGQKDLRASRPLASLTTLPAQIVGDDGRPIAGCRLRFQLRTQLVPFLASWRVA